MRVKREVASWVSFVFVIFTLSFPFSASTVRVAPNDQGQYLSRRESQNYQSNHSRKLLPTITANASNDFVQVKQRKVHNYSPTYDIIDLAPYTPDSRTELPKNYSNDEQFYQNIVDLKKIMLEKRNRLLKKQANELPGSSKQKNATLESDINTINLLIGMLLLANKRLVEQRDRLPAESSPSEVRVANGGHESVVQPATKQVTKVDHQHTRVEQVRLAGNKTVSEKLGDKSESKNTARKKSKKGKKPKKQKQSDGHADHILVRPGFDHAPDKESSPSEHMKSAGQHPALLLNHAPVAIGGSQEHDDPMRNHRPLVAQDLLNVARIYPQSYPSDGHLAHGQPNERTFASQPKLPREHPFYEYLQRQPPAYGPQQYLDPRQAEAEEEQARMHGVPPYNGLHSEGWTQIQPNHPQVVAGQPVAAQQVTEEDPYAALRPANVPQQRPETGIQQQQQQHNDIAGGQPFGPVGHPIHHMLMAAKKQQQAALAYERRRLEHEMELQKRQQLMRKQHDELIERQRQQMKSEEEARQNQEHEQRAKQQQQQPDEQPAKQQEKQQEQQQQQSQDANQNQQQQQQDNDANNEGQQQDEGGEQQEQDQQQQDQQPEQKEDDPDMKNFQNFAGDTDFTDLFPPGILSEAEIKEMRRDQAEQRQRQEQEEREKQQQEQSEQEEQGDGEQQQQQQQQDSGAAEQAPEQQQQQAPEQQQIEQSATNSSSNSGATSLKAKSVASNQMKVSSPQNGTSNKETGAGPQQQQQQQQQLEPRANKTRRSDHAALSFDQRNVQFDDDNEDDRVALLSSDSQEYHDRYIKPFLVTSAADGEANY